MAEVNLTDATFEQEVLNEEKLVLVDFYAPWCGPCRSMAPIIEKLAEEYKVKAKICKLNIDENSVTSQKYGIQSIPTLIFFKDGKAIDKLVGFQSAETIKAKLDSL